MKTIVTHLSPDLDALTAVWLIKRYLLGWKNSEVKYVPAGKTLEEKLVDSDPNVIHVDTGLGRFDHHQTNSDTCSAKLVYEYLVNQDCVSPKIKEALSRLVSFVNDVDHFRNVDFPDPVSDRWDFSLYQLIEGLKSTLADKNKIEETVFSLLDASLQILINKVVAQMEIKKGFIFNSFWGKSLVMESKNSEVLNLALKMRYNLVAKKDPEKGNVRIKVRPDAPDLTPLYGEIVKNDKKATWFLHVSKKMLLNGSAKNTTFTPSSLSVKRLIELIKKV